MKKVEQVALDSKYVLKRTHPVLLVDDSVDIHHLVRAHLRHEPVELSCAECGQSGMRLARETPPDLILLDVDLPGSNGFALCRELKTDPRTAKVPVIFLSGA